MDILSPLFCLGNSLSNGSSYYDLMMHIWYVIDSTAVIEYGRKDGRRPALYKPTAFEIEKMRNRDNAAGDDDWEDEFNVERNFWVTFIRKNPMRKPGQRIDVAEWGDADASLMGPNGPSFIGKVFRDPMSAKVKLVYDGHNRYDFHAVDLWTRPTVEGSIEKLKKDRYLFKPIPMLYRTWMYHESYRHHKNIDATSEDAGVIREILNFMCIDADLSAGRWSPLVALLPASFCCALTCDELSVGAAVVLTWIMQRAGMMLNSPERYKELRFWLLLPRLTWMAFVIWRAVSWIPDAVALNIIGLIGTLIFCLLDLFYGDKETFAKYRLSCSYEILKTLPNRVFVCRRVGAADLEKLFGGRGHVHQNVTGIGAWARDMVVIAEIMGCIFELQPFSQKDWNLLIQQSRGDDNARLSVWGLDCYNRSCPTFLDLRRRQQVESAAFMSKVGTRHASGQVDADRLLNQLATNKSLFQREMDAHKECQTLREHSPPGTPKNQPDLDDDVMLK